jgi:hypothetical protein
MGQGPNISLQIGGKKLSFDFGLNSLMLASANLRKFMGFYKGAYRLKSGPFWRAIDRGRSGVQSPTFLGN